MIQSIFETSTTFTDSVWYDASSWSLVHFYNMPYSTSNLTAFGNKIEDAAELVAKPQFDEAKYAYLVDWNDYNSAALLAQLHLLNIKVYAAFKPFSMLIENKEIKFNYGTLMIPVSLQTMDAKSLYEILIKLNAKYNVPIYASHSGFSKSGSYLGSENFKVLNAPKALMLIFGSVSSYEAGEVWHFFDQNLNYPLTKLPIEQFKRVDLSQYNTLILVSGSYAELDSNSQLKLKNWVNQGNTLITSRLASQWLIKQKLVSEKLVEALKKEKKEGEIEPLIRLPYDEASERAGAKETGGAIFEVDIDLTHPLAFGYTQSKIPVYRNSEVYIAPSQNPYSTVAKYSTNPLINGYITKENLNIFLKPSASLIVSAMGQGRAILFADDPNFRGAWQGTNKMLSNALFFGSLIRVPK
jgi:hypothetical protein